jgi:hypothetical protein
MRLTSHPPTYEETVKGTERKDPLSRWKMNLALHKLAFN